MNRFSACWSLLTIALILMALIVCADPPSRKPAGLLPAAHKKDFVPRSAKVPSWGIMVDVVEGYPIE